MHREPPGPAEPTRNPPAPAPSAADEPAGQAPPLRLFLALWPHPAALQATRTWRDAWTWPEHAVRVPPSRLHLTLHFIGPVPAARLAEVEAGLDRPCARFDIEFGRAAIWPGGLALMTPLAVPQALVDLHATLGEALRALDLPVDERPFKPHVTLARKADDAVPPPARAAFRWPVGGYALVLSERGYHTIRRYRAPSDR
jgi:2'-5' RNA ligase